MGLTADSAPSFLVGGVVILLSLLNGYLVVGRATDGPGLVVDVAEGVLAGDLVPGVIFAWHVRGPRGSAYRFFQNHLNKFGFRFHGEILLERLLIMELWPLAPRLEHFWTHKFPSPLAPLVLRKLG